MATCESSQSKDQDRGGREGHEVLGLNLVDESHSVVVSGSSV